VAHLPALAFARKTALPWIANWNDPGGSKMPPPYGSGPDTSVGYIHERFLRDIARSADLHTFPCQRLHDYMVSYLGQGVKSRSSIIPHIAAKTVLSQPSDRKLFSICYAGNLQLQRRPDFFFAAFKRFVAANNADNRIRIEFIGIETVGLSALTEHYDIEKYLTFLGPMSYPDTLVRLAESTVNLVIEAPCAEGVFLPSKIVDYAQVGRPILAVSPNIGTLSDLLEKFGGGLAADCTSESSIYNALCLLYNSWKDKTLDDMYSSYCLADYFSSEKITASYKNIFEHNVQHAK
jgi:hypothetical protein